MSTPSVKTIADAYVYLLGRALVVRQEHIDRHELGFSYNTLKFNPVGSAEFVNPNLDVAYLEAWIAVDEHTPVFLDVPEIVGRYYTVQILDEWGEVIANINERTIPTKPSGTFAFLLADSDAKVPDGTGRILLHSSKAKLLARIELKNDREGALRLQHSFRMWTQSRPHIVPPPMIPRFDNEELAGVGLFDCAEALLTSALDIGPHAAEIQERVRAVAAYAAHDDETRASVDRLLKTEIVAQFKEYALTKAAPYRDHWMGGNHTGNYEGDYWLRAAVNYAGIWANTSDEVVYFLASRDADENPLNGSNSYVINFPADALPQSVVNSYWSTILVTIPDYHVVPNALGRFNVNSYSPLKKDADGSLKIAIGPKPVPGIPESNWLPAPEGRAFALTFRAYVPKEAVLHGEWSPPAVRPLRAARRSDEQGSTARSVEALH